MLTSIQSTLCNAHVNRNNTLSCCNQVHKKNFQSNAYYHPYLRNHANASQQIHTLERYTHEMILRRSQFRVGRIDG